MAEFRTLLAAVLGVGLGALFVVYPEAIVRIQTAGKLPHDRGSDYGTDSRSSNRVRWAIRLLGVGALIAGVYFGAVAVGVA
ncbi:putative membrane protein [Halanaeroarchaeum sp. HSR-CO]|uniref:hypothetical protein n=1 Tax=Halanaeroarchaeum sp. HSR-CO TaxID=2866382 RepID=UPI00217E38CC|nr:hypothetical protein [Halanaeroarchaeum sp. HSR-CO]UWG46855.1 putative membrane protein [Halanaeroarchaeum sp. HSR-CO]